MLHNNEHKYWKINQTLAQLLIFSLLILRNNLRFETFYSGLGKFDFKTGRQRKEKDPKVQSFYHRSLASPKKWQKTLEDVNFFFSLTKFIFRRFSFGFATLVTVDMNLHHRISQTEILISYTTVKNLKLFIGNFSTKCNFFNGWMFQSRHWTQTKIDVQIIV